MHRKIKDEVCYFLAAFLLLLPSLHWELLSKSHAKAFQHSDSQQNWGHCNWGLCMFTQIHFMSKDIQKQEK